MSIRITQSEMSITAASTCGTSSKGSPKSSSCNNKAGKNQYKDRPAPDDPLVSSLLRNYHSKGVTDRTQVSKLLLEEHGIILGESSISRRKRKLGLKASHLTTLELDVNVKRQLILDQMAKDPKGRLGARMVKQGILRDTGIHLTRDYIREEMKNLDPVAHAARGPAHVKAKRQQKQLIAQASSVSAPIQQLDSDPNLNLIITPAQIVPLDRSSGSTRSYQLRPISSSPVPHSAVMEVGEDSDTGIPPYLSYSQVETSDQPDVLRSPNATPALAADLLLPLPGPVISPSMTVALDILRNIAPQMSALAGILDGLVMNQTLDVQAYGLVTSSREAAALLELQLARVASTVQCSRS